MWQSACRISIGESSGQGWVGRIGSCQYPESENSEKDSQDLIQGSAMEFSHQLFGQNYIKKQLIWELFQQIMHRDIKKEMVLASISV